ncbi:MAG: extracellular solute-binding protein [Holosporales bacterium]|nr:extracellular solute-binding protein [Holosporales bacterium]
MLKSRLKKAAWAAFAIFAGALIVIKPIKGRPCVNIYCWYGALPQSVIEQFEAETGIHVHYDVFDNNEMLEAKLLASNSGYDVVMPTITPYGARQLHLRIYHKLDKSKLPALRQIDPVLQDKIKDIDADMDYLLPYYWGTTGIAFDEDRLNAIIPDIPKDDTQLLFDINVVKKISPYGISLLQEPVDVFPCFLEYLGKNRNSRSLEDLWYASQRLAEVSQYIRRFSSSRFVIDLVLGDVCVAQAWSGEALRAIDDARKIGRHIRYIIPKNGGDIWIDAIAIPIGAPHVNNAHAFINFLLRPDISAQITNQTQIATMVAEAKPLIKKEILTNTLIFPTHDTLKSLQISPVFTGQAAEAYERIRMRMWAQIKMLRPMDRDYFDTIVQKQCARTRK